MATWWFGHEARHIRRANPRLHHVAADAPAADRRAHHGRHRARLAAAREEDPQISVPMVDIMVPANGYKAE
jgi:hypothetical protein